MASSREEVRTETGTESTYGIDVDGVDIVSDEGEGMLIVRAPLEALNEQDINARIMTPQDQAQLVSNIRHRGKLESLPYCALMNGRIEIVSGHHRIQAAREAKLESVLIILDVSGLTRSELIAKQLAHNRLSGYDDPQTLTHLYSLLDTVDDQLESGLSNDEMEVINLSELPDNIAPRLDIEWQTLSLALPAAPDR